MTLDQRKIHLAQSVLQLEDESLLQKVEDLLRNVRMNIEFKPITLEELHKRLDCSEKEFEAGEFVSATDLLAKYRRILK